MEYKNIIHVIGLGESAKHFKPDGHLTIGVNDVEGCGRNVCVDRPSVFNTERLKAIESLKVDLFFTHLEDWNYLPRVKKIKLKNIAAHNDRWNDFIPSSNNSPFVACGVAYHFYGATEIKLWGVDFNDHPNIKDEMREQSVRDYALLNKKLGGIISVHPDSYLYGKI
jgi:hypothetical protein